MERQRDGTRVGRSSAQPHLESEIRLEFNEGSSLKEEVLGQLDRVAQEVLQSAN